MERIILSLIVVCIVSEILVILFRNYVSHLKYILLVGSIPILFCAVYNLRFLMDGVQGLHNYVSNPHISNILIIIALTIAYINYLTFLILKDLK